jgi:hypothetical protein
MQVVYFQRLFLLDRIFVFAGTRLVLDRGAWFQLIAPKLKQTFRPLQGPILTYAFKELADRAFGKMKEIHAHEISPYRDMSNEDLNARIAELERELGVPAQLPPASEESKPN